MGSTFKQDLNIDKFALDTEWIKQPMLVFQWQNELEQAYQERDRTKQQAELLKAQLDSGIRKDPGSFGIDKISENAIANAIILDKDYQKALDAVRESNYEAGVIKAATSALSDKRAALDNLTRLFLSGYWAEGKRPTNEVKPIVESATVKAQEAALAANPRLNRLKRPK